VLDTASIGYDYDPDSCSEPRIVPRPEARDGFHSTPVSALDLAVVEPHEFEDKKKTVSAFWDSIRYAPRRPGFNACVRSPLYLGQAHISAATTPPTTLSALR
jgi:hypothetical protein